MAATASDRPLLVAPRPVRISSAFARVKVADANELEDLKIGLSPPISDKDLASPRTSSRSSLPSEALEEFLSILRPTFFSPTSPILRARLHGSTISLPNIPSERPYPFKSRGRIEVVHRKTEPNDIMLVGGGAGAEDNNNSNNNTERTHHPTSQTILDISSSSTPESASDKGESGGAEFDIDFLATRWNASHCHSSPISRMQTRNPFQRHPSYEMPSSPTSPLAPTPDPLLLSPLDEVPEGS
jgi:hypothetical protein